MHSVQLGRQRIAAAFVAIALYVAFLLYNIVTYSPVLPSNGEFFVASIIIGVLFQAVGMVVWLFARDRRVASLCFLCFVLAALAFTGEAGAITQDTLHSALTDGVLVNGALYCMVLLVVHFPCNLLEEDARHGTRQRLLRAWLVMLFVLAIMSGLSNFMGIALGRLAFTVPFWVVLKACDTDYSLGTLLTILVVIVSAFRGTSSPRQRQQLRLYAAGILMAFLPLFLLTALPLGLFGAPHYIPGQFTTLSMVALPLCMGYAVLRYQLLTLDRPIRHFITFIVAAISLLVAACSLLLAVDLLRLKQAALPIDAAVLVVLVPLVGWWSQKISTWIFSPQDEYYWELAAGTTGMQPCRGLESVVASLLAAVKVSLHASQASLLLLDEETGAFRLVQSLQFGSAREEAQGEDLLRSLARQLGDSVHGQVTLPGLVQQRLQSTNRPLLLREVLQEEQRFGGGLMRYFARQAPLLASEPLVAPLCTHQTLVGLLFVGERIDQQPYGGPDFERIALLLERFLPEVERFRSESEDLRHRQRLQTLYRLSALIESHDKTLQELVAAYAQILSDAMEAGTEVWWLDESTGASLQRVFTYGTPMLSTHTDQLRLREGSVDWQALFYDRSPQEYGGANSLFPQPLLLSVPTFPFAWLPLIYEEQRFGVLVLTFARPHRFSSQERQVLCVYAEQCAYALASTRLAHRQQRKISVLCEQEEQMVAALLVGEQVLQRVLEVLQRTLADPGWPASAEVGQPGDESENSLRGIAHRPGRNAEDLPRLLALLRCHSPHIQSIGKEGMAFVQQAAAFIDRVAVGCGDDSHLGLPVNQQPAKVVVVVTQTAQRQRYLSDALLVLGLRPHVCESCKQFLQWASCLAPQDVPLALLLDPGALEVEPDVFYQLLVVQFQAARLPRVYVLSEQGGRLASFAEWFSVLQFPLSPTRLRQALLEADEK